MSEEKHNNALLIVLILAMIVAVIVLITDIGRGVDIKYVLFYTIMLVVGIFGLIVMFGFGKIINTDEDEFSPSLFDSGSARLLAGLPFSRTIAAILLIVVFVVASVATQHSFIPVVNPYDSAKLIHSQPGQFSAQGTVTTALRSAIYPGLGEDISGMIFTTVVTLLLIFVVARRFDDEAETNPGFLIPCIVIASATWGWVFSSAHSTVYGLDSSAYWAAFIYGFTSQLVNMLVGAPAYAVHPGGKPGTD